MRIPPPEWNLSRIDLKRASLLSSAGSYETIVEELTDTSSVTGGRAVHFRNPPKGAPKNICQIIFIVSALPHIIDQLWNAPDGLRARYWRSSSIGDAANRLLIDKLTPLLLMYKGLRDDRYKSIHEVETSLSGVSAKAWPLERNSEGQNLFMIQELIVPRWERNELYAEVNKGMWRLTPLTGYLEIKGALIDTSGREHIPEGKRDRSMQIHRFGFT